MSVQREKFAQLAIDDPPHRAVCVLALDAEYSLVTVHGVKTVADPDTESMK